MWYCQHLKTRISHLLLLLGLTPCLLSHHLVPPLHFNTFLQIEFCSPSESFDSETLSYT